MLLFLFGSKDGLIRELLARARADELEALDDLNAGGDVAVVGREIWGWLAAEEHRGLLVLWLEGYARSLVEPDGPWTGFARATVDDWLVLLGRALPEAGDVQRTLVLAALRGCLLDLLATGDRQRVTAAVYEQLDAIARPVAPSKPA